MTAIANDARENDGADRDWAAVRADFPLLTRTVNGKPLK